MEESKRILARMITGLILGTSRRMSWAFRYSTSPSLRRESVAEHSWYVAFYCLAIYEHAVADEIQMSFALDELLSKAIVHDLDESITGDIVRPFKYSDKNLTRQIKFSGNREMYQQYHKERVPETVLDSAHASKTGDLGYILRIADIMSVISFQVEEKDMGNSYSSDILVNTRKYLLELIDDLKGCENERLREFLLFIVDVLILEISAAIQDRH